MSDQPILIIDYGAGNLRSAAKAVERVAEGRKVRVSSDPAQLASASHILLPGVGAFADCMRGLSAISGMREALEKEVLECKKPFLGICVGMQLLFERGHEHGLHAGLGWLKGEVRPLQGIGASFQHSGLKIPHMGWNELHLRATHPLLAGIPQEAHAYFVHSYHAVCADGSDVLATTDYGGEVTAVVAHDNIMGTQFHPEKSQETGLRLLRNFLLL